MTRRHRAHADPRRAAGEKRYLKSDRFGRYADGLLDEREFFVRKAIGGVLRETGKKRPDLVYSWLAPRAHRASGVTLCEAVKYLPAKRRSTLMTRWAGKPRPTGPLRPAGTPSTRSSLRVVSS